MRKSHLISALICGLAGVAGIVGIPELHSETLRYKPTKARADYEKLAQERSKRERKNLRRKGRMG